MKRNSTDYYRAVKLKYEIVKSEVYEGFLLKPSPANLRDFCLLLLENGLGKKDLETFSNFFQSNPNQELKKAIHQFDVEKFKPICNFLKGISQNTSSINLNLIAVLINFEPRPLSKFIIAGSEQTEQTEQTEQIEQIEQTEREEEINTDSHLIKLDKVKIKKKGYKNAVVISMVSIFGILGVQKLKDKPDECMQWREKEYVIINCDSGNLQNFSDIPVLALNEGIVNLKKVNPYEFKPYFKYGKPILWYHKMNGQIEYFNSEGKHPVTGKQLKPITQYMVNKYLKEK
jgi:hypothetical protein